MQNATINVNGNIRRGGIKDAENTQISVFDRSYLYGDSLYEVVRTHQGKLLFLEEHLARLAKSAEICHMKLDPLLDHFQSEMERTLNVFQSMKSNQNGQSADPEAYVRLIVSRGAGKIGFDLSCLETPILFTIIVQPLEAPSKAQFEEGMKLSISKRIRNHPRALDPAMKSGNYLNSLLAFLEAKEGGFHDALLCNAEGYLTEGTTFNLFYIRRGMIATPPLDVGILDGITRRKVIEVAALLGIPVREVRFKSDRLLDASEVFLTSTIKEIFPITHIDGHQIGDGRPGPMTRKLLDSYRNSLGGKL